ncbi:hypothetical protein [Microbulbifer sp. YPW16]|uniref:hypothetical protein n=1 Tax=Microbulbifer sp. YPW16 TaxID=2904242 RepID=UPI001E38A768|nr:hypothetical protein [Microbulbifer sp. YPW16]UHQ56311.1 hypothetical protein LVE68_04840 [Microbulbifer sp. YPW16]
MSGRKNKNRQRGQRHQHQRNQGEGGKSTELLDELNSIRDLLGSEELGDIPLLDQVADPAPVAPAPVTPPAGPAASSHARIQPLEDTDLPTLFSPEDEEPVEDDAQPEGQEPAGSAVPPSPVPGISTELSETERALLRPLESLPSGLDTTPPRAKPAGSEQQQELFGEDTATPARENPFLPAHIRARLTGGRVPRSEDTAPEPATDQPVDAASIPEDEPAATSASLADSTAARPVADEAPADPAEPGQHGPGPDGTAEHPTGRETGAERLAREEQRQQLVEKLVARQLPELERQLRARIEIMVDELMRRR